MRGWAFLAAFLFASLFAPFSPSIADAPALAKSVRVMFFGYLTLNGTIMVQLHIDGIAAADQPGPLKTGDHFNLGSLGVFTVGAIHPMNPVPVLGGRPVPVNNATVDLIDTSGHKTTLKLRTDKEVKVHLGALTNALLANHPRAATA